MQKHSWQLLDRELDAQAIEEATQRVARGAQGERRGTHPAVVFRIGAEWLALPAAIFDEITEMRAIHALPHRSDDVVLGLTNVRGELLICISLAHILGIEVHEAKNNTQPNAYRRLVVLRSGADRIVFPADDVYGTHWFNPEDLKDIPATIARSAARYTKAVLPWRDRTVGFIDERMLFFTVHRSLA